MRLSWRAAMVTLGAGLSVFGFVLSGLPVLAAGDGCSQGADPKELKLMTDNHVEASDLFCQKTSEAPNGLTCIKSSACGAGALCCITGSGAPTGAKASQGTSGAAIQGSIWIPADIQACMQRGDCGLEQIVKTGAAFANFLFGLSGAVALLILVYGGFQYLISAGDTAKVQKAQHMITDAAIGLVFIFTANALIRFVYTSFAPTGSDTSPNRVVSACENYDLKQRADYQKAVQDGKAPPEAPQSFLCKVVPGDTDGERTNNATAAGCNASISCNAAGVYCCPLEPPKPGTAGGTK